MKIIIYILFLLLFTQAQSLDESVSYLSNYIISEEFAQIKQFPNELEIIDSLYAEALRYHYGDVEEALLTMAFATLAFKYMPLQIPIVNAKLNFPLSSVEEELFQKKVAALPKKIFFNSPNTKFGDKDKLAHFFGSAHLAHSVTIFNLSEFMGIFIEHFEATFKVEGSLSKRDLIVNSLGIFFGKSLNQNPQLMPSQALKHYNLLYFRITN